MCNLGDVPDIESWSVLRLLSVASRLLECRCNKALSDLALSKAAVITLAAVEVVPDANQEQLAARIGVTGQSLGRLLRRLETGGLIDRQTDFTDHSLNSRATLTGKGRELLCRAQLLETECTPPEVETSEKLRCQLIRVIECLRHPRKRSDVQPARGARAGEDPG